MKNFLQQKTVLYIGIALMIIGISGLVSDNKSENNVAQDVAGQVAGETTTIISNADGTIVNYQGQDGVTALEILKNGAEVISEDSSFGEFVTTINGVKQTNTEFWLFYINDEPASVGAGDYVTNEGDEVEWRLEG